MLIEQLNDTEFKAAQIVCEHYDISVLDLFGTCRSRAKNKAQSVFAWAMRELNPTQHIGVLAARINIKSQQRFKTLAQNYAKIEMRSRQKMKFKIQYLKKSNA